MEGKSATNVFKRASSQDISSRRTLWLYQFIYKAIDEKTNNTSFLSDLFKSRSYR